MSDQRTPAVSVVGFGADGAVEIVPGSWPGGVGPEVVAVPVVSGAPGSDPADPGSPAAPSDLPHRLTLGGSEVDWSLDGAAARRRGFSGALGKTLTGASGGGAVAEVVWVGVGDPAAWNDDTLRRLAAGAVRGAGRARSVVVVVPGSVLLGGGGADAVGVDAALAAGRGARALAEGAVLAAYRFSAHKSDPGDEAVEQVILALPGDVDLQAAVHGAAVGAAVGRATCLARDLVNEPPSSMTPSRLADEAVRLLGDVPGVSVEVWDEQRIASERLGGLLGVARGSAEPPRLIWARYEPADPYLVDGKVPHLVLVGKGITFDSGGLSLKTAGGMTTMKTDMSGAAAVLGALSACAAAGVRISVTGITPVTENMPGGGAIKPGDVLQARNGKTIEVLNTDAEGRLILADGLSLAAELAPDAIVDLATLTGACVVALGGQIAGLFGNDDGLAARVGAAAQRAGEATWPLPLVEEYRAHIESDIADMKNVGKNGQAGAIAAALLLANFVGETPWVHLDIAGPARSDEDRGVVTKGGTGFGVRTLVALAESFAVPAEQY